MTLLEFWATIQPDAAKWSFVDQIKAFGWFLHTHGAKDHFSNSDIRQCYETLSVHPPQNSKRLLDSLTERKPKHLIKKGSEYALEYRIKAELDQKFGHRQITVSVHKLLHELVDKMPTPQSAAFLEETLICFRHKAFRAAVVMAWNVTFDHLCLWILSDTARLNAFNTQAQTQFGQQKRPPPIIKNRSEFSEFKESDLIAVCRSSGIIADGNITKILSEKLDKRNQAAHPSNVVIDQLVAEGVISDLINNVVLVLK